MYDPLWLEGRETLYVKHVLCPKAEPYSFTHSADVIACVLSALAYSIIVLMFLIVSL